MKTAKHLCFMLDVHLARPIVSMLLSGIMLAVGIRLASAMMIYMFFVQDAIQVKSFSNGTSLANHTVLGKFNSREFFTASQSSQPNMELTIRFRKLSL